ncbi:hypothetical protein RM545_07695 [Zunongwangia sp. F260]|uniref:YD repeat-containing protein n=1 Tax=Autumnicola lenta TaxID=3075593 RepID=A0ABU3CJP0_9FLAO|nr:hypothetical protein [Zunongwangia sp. F260]MDT0646568.1 hypothetical protein [Zunongwangia sp. F260]
MSYSLIKKIISKGLLLIFLILISSCSSDSPNDPEPIPSEGNLLKSEKEYSFGILEKETNFYYNSDGNISKIDVNSVYEGIGTFEYFYDDNGRMESYTLSLLSPFGDQREENTILIYEGDEIVRSCTNVFVTGEDESFFPDPTVDKVEFEYNSSGQVTKVIKYQHDYQETASCESLEYIDGTITMEYDSKGNLTRMEDTSNIFGPTYLTYTHDNTFHPYRNLKPVYFRNIYNYSSQNNVTSAEEFNSDSNEKVGYVEYNYEFNEEDYPVSLNRKWSTADNSIFQSYTYQFTYY